MPILTTYFRTQLAKDLFNASDVWIGIGRSAAWPDDNNPPAEDLGVTALDTPIAYKKILTKFLVIPDGAGTLQFKNQNYTIVTVADAFTQGVLRTYMEMSFDYDEIPLTTFRQVGIFRGLVPATGFGSQLVLLPAQVGSTGALISYSNIKPEPRAIDRKNLVRRIILF